MKNPFADKNGWALPGKHREHLQWEQERALAEEKKLSPEQLKEKRAARREIAKRMQSEVL